LPFSGGLAWLNKSRREQNQGKSASDDVGVLLPFFVPISGDSGSAIPFFILQHHPLALAGLQRKVREEEKKKRVHRPEITPRY